MNKNSIISYQNATGLNKNAIASGLLCTVFVAAMVISTTGYASHRDQSEVCVAMQDSAAQGGMDAQYALGMMYKQGRDCPQDLVMSFFWLDLSARAGYAPAFPPSDEVSESLTPHTMAQIGKAEDQWLACQYNHSPCDLVHQLKTDLLIESMDHL